MIFIYVATFYYSVKYNNVKNAFSLDFVLKCHMKKKLKQKRTIWKRDKTVSITN